MDFIHHILIISLVALNSVCKCVNLSTSDIQSLRATPVVSSKLQEIPSNFDADLKNLKYSAILPMSRDEVLVQTSRGFNTNEGYSDIIQKTKLETDGWSPYHIHKQKDSTADSTSNVKYKIQKKTDNRQGYVQNDFQNQGYTPPNYSDMMLMMQFMKKMDDLSPRQGFLSSFLESPTAFVVAVFIPISLLIAVTLPFIVNMMMNGITIPPLIPTNTAKARSLLEITQIDFTNPVFRDLVEFGTRYMDHPDCLHRIFCEMAIHNSTQKSNINYFGEAINTAANYASDELLKTLGINDFIKTVKSGNCQVLRCDSEDKKSREDILNLIDNIMFKYAQNVKPRKN